MGFFKRLFGKSGGVEDPASGPESASDALSAAREHLRVSFYQAHDQVRAYGVCREAMDGVIAALVYDLPDKVSVVKREEVLAWKRPLDELFALAASNVKANDPVKVEQAELGQGTSLTVLSAEHHFAASHALFLADYLDPQNQWGALVAVPNRHVMILYPIVDRRVMLVVNSMIQTAHNIFRQGPGSISPNLYWWRNGEFLLLPARMAGNETEFTPPDAFVDLMNQLMA